MIRKLKTLGLAMMAVLALSAVGASASQAANFTASSYPSTFTGVNGSGNEVFTTDAGNVECNSHFSGSASEDSETISAHPTYTGCKAFGFLSATVTTTGCDYLFHVGSEVSADVYNSSVDVVCEAGKTIVVASSGCEVKIGAQSGLTNVKFTNDTGAGDVTVDSEVNNQIDYNVTKDTFPCPFNGTGERFNGSYNSTVGATIDSAQTIHIG